MADANSAERVDIQIIKHGKSVDVRIERNNVPHYATFEQRDMGRVVAMLIDAGFVPEWEANNG